MAQRKASYSCILLVTCGFTVSYYEGICKKKKKTTIIAEHISARLFAVALRNVNLRSRPGRISDTTCIRRHFLVTEDGDDSSAGSLQCMYLVESSAEASAERSRRLVTLTKNKTKTPGKRSVHLRSQESKKRTRKSSTVESTYCQTCVASH